MEATSEDISDMNQSILSQLGTMPELQVAPMFEYGPLHGSGSADTEAHSPILPLSPGRAPSVDKVGLCGEGSEYK